jgi:hypothetical protein
MSTLAAFATCIGSGLADFGSDMGRMLAEFGACIVGAFRG